MRIRQTDIIETFRRLQAQYTPVVIKSIEVETGAMTQFGIRADAVVEFEIEGGLSFRALAEIASLGTPKSIRDKCVQVLNDVRKAEDPALMALVIAPYVPAKQAQTLREAGVSWMDLSGNMVLRVPNRVYIERTGQPNRYPDTAPIRKIFEGTTSLVTRALLLEPAGFASVSEIVDFIRFRGASITLPTVSKALRLLEEELLVSRGGGRISVVDSGWLMDRLVEGYGASARRRGSVPLRLSMEDTEQTLRRFCSLLGSTYVFCGFYAAQLKGLAQTNQIVMYAQDMDCVAQAVKELSPDVRPDEEFGQVSVIETRDRTAWFNAQALEERPTVDDLELYLEMTLDTPRGPTIARILRTRILGSRAHG